LARIYERAKGAAVERDPDGDPVKIIRPDGRILPEPRHLGLDEDDDDGS
jgi:hypothetical protein